MTFIWRKPMLMLLILPSLEAIRSSRQDDIDWKVSSLPWTPRFADREPPRNPRSFMRMAVLAVKSASPCQYDVSLDSLPGEEGEFCKLYWWYMAHDGRMRRELRFWTRLDTEQKAFTYMKAYADTWDPIESEHISRDGTTRKIPGHTVWTQMLSIKDDKDKLIVGAYAHHPAEEDNGRVPTISAGAVRTPQRRRVETMLSKSGPYSPLGHLKGEALDSLIKRIDWEKDGGNRTCQRIYDFISANGPDGYNSGSLNWLTEFVRDKARVVAELLEKRQGQ